MGGVGLEVEEGHVPVQGTEGEPAADAGLAGIPEAEQQGEGGEEENGGGEAGGAPFVAATRQPMATARREARAKIISGGRGPSRGGRRLGESSF